MTARYTLAAGAVTDVAKWDGGATLPVAGDAVTIKHAMTIGTGKTFPDAGTDPFLSLNLAGTGGSSPGLTVTGTVTIRATTITGFQNLSDAAATNLSVVGNVSASSYFNCNAPKATPTTITGSWTSTERLLVNTNCGLTVTGNVSASSTGNRGIDVLADGVLNVGGSCSGISTYVGASVYDGVQVSDGATLTATSLTGSCTSNTGNGIKNYGTITGPGGSPAKCSCFGTAANAGAGIYCQRFSPGDSIVGDCVGAAGAGGVGISSGGSYQNKMTGNQTGTCGAGGVGILFASMSVLYGDILLTADPTSAWIRLGNWLNEAGTGAAKIRATTNLNTIQMGDAQEFCPTANVAAAANVRSGAARYTGGTSGTLGIRPRAMQVGV
jgi:hypothetical protein